MVHMRWFYKPLSIFIYSLLALGLSLFIFIRSYLQVNEAFRSFVLKHNLNPGDLIETESWIIILILSVLVALIIAGLILIFVYYNKVIQLYRMQQNYINGFTHELKTPIASLQLFLNTFQKHELSRQDQLKYIDYMLNDTQRLANNVDEILNISKLEDKRYEFISSYANLEEEINKYVDKNRHQFEGMQINVDGEGDFYTLIDLNLFELVVMNLIVNAYNHNDKEEKLLDIELVNSGKNIQILFRDNGNGIALTEFKKVFKKFYQVGHSAKGSGLGLYLVQMVLKALGGSVVIKNSKLAQGTTFLLSIPKKESM